MDRFFKKKMQGEKTANLSEFIMGKHSVEEALKHVPDRVKELLVAKSASKIESPLIEEAENLGIKITFISKDQLTNLLQSDSHQGFAAKVKRFFYHDVLEFIDNTHQENRPTLYVALDSIYDPHNFGAILRASECFGVKGVIYSKNRGVDVTASVSKASVGASEILPLLKVSNLAQTMSQFKDEGFEIVTAEIANEAASLDSFRFSDKTVLILGSEGEGIRKLLSDQADHKVYIRMFGKIDSLNVSQAASVIFAFWAKQFNS